MGLRRFRTAVLALLAAVFLTYLAYARLTGTEHIRVGMPLLQAQLIMLSPGQPGEGMRVTKFLDPLQERWRYKTNPGSVSRCYQWEDATRRVNVRATPTGPFSTLGIVELDREPREQPDLGTAWAWRLVASVVWLPTFILLFRAAFEPKPAVALNSPGAPDTTNGAGSSA